jgi:tetratricopeptide (TPR) repeat protein
MSSLVPKTNKSRSQASRGTHAPASKKASSKTQKPKKKISATAKSKSASHIKERKVSKLSPAKGRAKSAPASKKPVRKKAAANTKKSASATRPAAKPVQERRKAPLSPLTMAAVREFERALTIFNRHDFAAAKSAFENIVARFADQAEVIAPVRTYLAVCEHRLLRTPTAPRSADALYNQGVFEFNRGRTREAIEIFEKALKAEPRADHVLYSLSAAYIRIGDQTKAVDALRRAIALSPAHRSQARHDPDLAGLRTNREFQRITGLGLEYSD